VRRLNGLTVEINRIAVPELDPYARKPLGRCCSEGSKQQQRRTREPGAAVQNPQPALSLVGGNRSSCPRADDGGSLSRIGSAVLRRKRPLHDKFAHALHSSVHEREMICDRGSAVRGSMTSPDVRATSRAYVAGLERHKMEEWRTNAASGPRLGASSMTNRLYSSLDERRGSGHSQLHSQASLPAYFLAGRGIGVTPTCSSAVYGAP
jgi:hypothetical protein